MRGTPGGHVRKALIVGGALFLGLSVLGMPAAFAATKSPGLLQARDLPGSFQQSSGPVAYGTPTALIVTPVACTETPQIETAAVGRN